MRVGAGPCPVAFCASRADVEVDAPAALAALGARARDAGWARARLLWVAHRASPAADGGGGGGGASSPLACLSAELLVHISRFVQHTRASLCREFSLLEPMQREAVSCL